MLSAIRDRAKGWIAWIIVILITIPFALWGINSYFDALTRIVVAEVDGTEVDSQTYQRALADQRQALQQSLGGRIAPEILDSATFKLQVLEGIVGQLLLTQDAEEQGYRISDAQLKELIQSTGQFQRDGRFAPDLYEGALRRAGSNATEFEQRLREQNAIQQIQNGFTESAFLTTTDLNRMIGLQEQKRRFSYVQIKPGRFKKDVIVPAKEVEAYYFANKEKYRIPEQVRVEYVRLSVDDLIEKITPDEARLRQAYEENIGRYTIPEERRASHILIQIPGGADPAVEKRALEKAESLAKQIRDGAAFAALAKKHSDDTESGAKGGDLGYFNRGMIDQAFEEALYRLKPGEVSAPVRTSFGYHLIKLAKLKPQVRKAFAAVRAQLVKEVSRKQAEERFLELAETFSDFVYERPDSLKPAAETLQLKIQQSAWFGRNGGTGIAANPKIVAAAFSEEVLNQELNSETIELDINTMVALRALGYRESTIKPLIAVRNEIERQLKDDLVRKRAVETGQKIEAALQRGDLLPKVAGRYGLKIRSPGLVSRRDTAGVDARLISALFRAGRPQAGSRIYGSVSLGDAGYVVFALDKVEEGNPANAKDELVDNVKKALTKRRGLGYYLSYQHGLRNRADIVIHADKL